MNNGKTIGDTFVPLTRSLLRNPLYQRLGINARRLLDFLALEHLQHGGARNGFLLAPRRHLEAAGIGARHVSRAIEEAEQAGLVSVKRGTGKRPSTYALTWLPMGTAPGKPKRYPGSLATAEGKSLQ
jgi:hypothetical protein